MALKSSLQSSNRVSLVGNPNADKIYFELLSQHEARKIEDPVSTRDCKFYREKQGKNRHVQIFFYRNTLNWILQTSK